MTSRRAFLGLAPLALALAACAPRSRPQAPPPGPAAGDAATRALVHRYADLHGIPESLLARVVENESGFNPAARNGPYYGLMQIHPATAHTMGYRGPPEGLLDAETNLLYGGRYLRGAWIVAHGDPNAAISWYRKGYYYEAKRLGLIEETGLRG